MLSKMTHRKKVCQKNYSWSKGFHLHLFYEIPYHIESFQIKEAIDMAIFTDVTHQNPIPLIIDTDPGEDADDAVTLSMVVNSKEVDVKLIVTTNEDIDEESGRGHYVAYAKEVLDRWGKEYDLYQGSTTGRHKFICHDMLPENWKELPFPKTDFLPEMRKVIETHERVAYLSIGPMTNLAKLIEQDWFQDKTLRDRVTIIQMGGWFKPGRAEYNIKCDPISAKKVFQSGIPIYLVTYDTTSQKELEISTDHPFFQELSSSDLPGHKLLSSAFKAFHRTHTFHPFLNDPLTFAAIFKDFVTFEKKKITVDEKSGRTTESDDGSEIYVSLKEFNHEGFLAFARERLLLMKK